MKKIFTNPICQWLFRWLHPDLGIGIANYFSRKSRAKTGAADEVFLGDENVLKLIKQRADNEQASSVYVTKESK